MQDCVAILKEILGLSASASSEESWLVGFIEELCSGCDAEAHVLLIKIARMTNSLLKNLEVRAWAESPDNRNAFKEDVRNGVIEGDDGKAILMTIKRHMQQPADERKAKSSRKETIVRR